MSLKSKNLGPMLLVLMSLFTLSGCLAGYEFIGDTSNARNARNALPKAEPQDVTCTPTTILGTTIKACPSDCAANDPQCSNPEPVTACDPQTDANCPDSGDPGNGGSDQDPDGNTTGKRTTGTGGDGDGNGDLSPPCDPVTQNCPGEPCDPAQGVCSADDCDPATQVCTVVPPPCDPLKDAKCRPVCDPDTGCQPTSQTLTMTGTPQVDIVWMLSMKSNVKSLQNSFDTNLDAFANKFLERAPQSGNPKPATEISYRMAMTTLNTATNQSFTSYDDPFSNICTNNTQSGSASILYRGSNGTFVNNPQILSSSAYRQDPRLFRFRFNGDTSGYGCQGWQGCSDLNSQGQASPIVGPSAINNLGIVPGSDYLPTGDDLHLIPGLDFAFIKVGHCQQTESAPHMAGDLIDKVLIEGSSEYYQNYGKTYPAFNKQMFPWGTLAADPNAANRWTVFVVVAAEDEASNTGATAKENFTHIGFPDGSTTTMLGNISKRLQATNGRDPRRLRIHAVTDARSYRLRWMAQNTHGKFFDIHKDFGTTLGNLGDEFNYDANSLPLSGPRPAYGRIDKVSYDGVAKQEGVDWVYDAVAHTIRFMVKDGDTYRPLQRPAAGVKVLVEYQIPQ